MDKNQLTLFNINLESNNQNEYSSIYNNNNNFNLITNQIEHNSVNSFNPSDIFDLAQIEQILANEHIRYLYEICFKF